MVWRNRSKQSFWHLISILIVSTVVANLEEEVPQINIVYLHGFASCWNPESEKIQQLSAWARVSGFDLDYCHGAEQTVDLAKRQLENLKPDLLIGCSMGGWLAAELGHATNLPFVALNPCIEPSITLKKHIGNGVDYQGSSYCLSPDNVQSYTAFNKQGRGLILLDSGDEVLNAEHTKQQLREHYPIIAFSGGSHRFEHIPQAIPEIKSWFLEANSLNS